MHLDAPDTPPGNVPEVPTYVERAGDGVWDLLLTCPYCGDLHLHGGGSDDAPAFGQRLSHCVQDGRRGDYALVPGPDDMPRPGMKPSIWRQQEWRDAVNGRSPR